MERGCRKKSRREEEGRGKRGPEPRRGVQDRYSPKWVQRPGMDAGCKGGKQEGGSTRD